jgi:hypothetical protein
MPRIVQVIESVIKRGEGTPESPVREVIQYHALSGEFLAETDPVREARRKAQESQEPTA